MREHNPSPGIHIHRCDAHLHNLLVELTSHPGGRDTNPRRTYRTVSTTKAKLEGPRRMEVVPDTREPLGRLGNIRPCRSILPNKGCRTSIDSTTPSTPIAFNTHPHTLSHVTSRNHHVTLANVTRDVSKSSSQRNARKVDPWCRPLSRRA